ncbi:TetR/AcrR family transcriptional regulator [Jannaschia sp. CCS1]|uniref:TetR/AcrR family transcriptional regulator n=1 Tax=Jannaschia sp. (strain CCS1) TaxID=290400 RepID=UPI000053D61B|nr:TetR/AcrR family transcriptional regulator [Jannaschia sp. CCS1]ABD55573.1 transcriptional regulator, TetR family [Jannaschia sp. CCS1]
MTNRLTPDDWIAAGFRALSESGPEALKAEALARRLQTTKGSFYWHFKDVPTFQSAMLDLWQDKAFSAIVAELEGIPAPIDKLRQLATIANDGAPDRFGGLLIEPAIRAWSLRDARAAAAVETIDTARIAYLANLMQAIGKPRSLAMLFYGAFVGLDDLQARGRPDTAGALSDLVERIIA